MWREARLRTELVEAQEENVEAQHRLGYARSVVFALEKEVSHEAQIVEGYQASFQNLRAEIAQREEAAVLMREVSVSEHLDVAHAVGEEDALACRLAELQCEAQKFFHEEREIREEIAETEGAIGTVPKHDPKTAFGASEQLQELEAFAFQRQRSANNCSELQATNARLAKEIQQWQESLRLADICLGSGQRAASLWLRREDLRAEEALFDSLGHRATELEANFEAADQGKNPEAVRDIQRRLPYLLEDVDVPLPVSAAADVQKIRTDLQAVLDAINDHCEF